VAVGTAVGGTRAVIPAAALVAILASRLVVTAAARWSIMVGVAIVVDLIIPEDGRYVIAGGVGGSFQLQPYRLIVAILLIGWFAALLCDPRVRGRSTKFEGPIGLILIATLGSELVNLGRVGAAGTTVLKALSLFLCFVLFLYLTVSVIRTRETVRALIKVLVFAGCIGAIGAVLQRQNGFNPFDHLHRFIPIFSFQAGAELSNLTRNGAVRAVGSAGHPIELSNEMAMLVPLAIYLAISGRKKIWWLAVLILGVGALASGSKTGMLELVGMLIVFLFMRPAQTLRCWPALIPIVVAMNIIVPGSISGIYEGFFPKGGFIASQSATFHGGGRVVDGTRLSRITPVLHNEFDRHNPLFGEGYGTRIIGRGANLQFLAGQAQVLDDQWFGTLIETGVFGFFGWLWLFVHIVRKLGKRAKLERDHPEGWLPVALAASLIGFLIGMATYDAFGFIQAVFVLFTLIALASVVLQLPPVTAASARLSEAHRA
jgi:hypothetical protein